MNIEKIAPVKAQAEEPYIGMPIYWDGSDDFGDMDDSDEDMMCENSCSGNDFEGWPLAMAYVPWQGFGETYPPSDGFKAGTIFPALNLPFLGGAK